MGTITKIGLVFLALGLLGVLGGLVTFLCCLGGVPLLIVGVVLILVDALSEPSRSYQPYPQSWPPPYPGYPAYPQAARVGPFCPNCGGVATWIPPYNRWYCYACRRYLPVEIPSPGPTLPPRA